MSTHQLIAMLTKIPIKLFAKQILTFLKLSFKFVYTFQPYSTREVESEIVLATFNNIDNIFND